MLTNLKALVVVLTLSVAAFQFTKPIVRQFCNEQDFARRRNLWITFTLVGFLSPSFWIFTFVAIPLLIWAGRKDSNPIALYMLLLHVIPPLDVEIPVFGINTLFAMNMYRLLALCVLLPLALHLRKERNRRSNNGPNFLWMDGLLLAFGLTQVLIFIRPDLPDASTLHDSTTNILRRGTLFLIDTCIPYYAVSRFCSTKRAMTEVMATACIAIVVMAPAAVFENVRHWLLYADVGQSWGSTSTTNYNLRAGIVRSALASGHPLALGYLFAIALGFWLYLRSHVKPALLRFGVPALLILGLIAAYSRGPWLGALIIYLAFAGLAPGGRLRLFKGVLMGLLSFGILLLSPLGNRIIAVIPFLGGTVDQYNVTYRQLLGRRATDMILHGPLFGDPNAYVKMHDLRQGVGVIDFVNTYAAVGVFYGIVGLSLFVGFILTAFFTTYLCAKRLASTDTDFACIGFSISACILGTMMMIYTSSFIYSYQAFFYLLAAIAVAYEKCYSAFTAKRTKGEAAAVGTAP